MSSLLEICEQIAHTLETHDEAVVDLKLIESARRVSAGFENSTLTAAIEWIASGTKTQHVVERPNVTFRLR